MKKEEANRGKDAKSETIFFHFVLLVLVENFGGVGGGKAKTTLNEFLIETPSPSIVNE